MQVTKMSLESYDVMLITKMCNTKIYIYMSLPLLVTCAVQVEAVQRHHQDVSEDSAGANLRFTGTKVSCAVSFSHPPPLPSPSLPSPSLSSPLRSSPPLPPPHPVSCCLCIVIIAISQWSLFEQLWENACCCCCC